MSYRRRKTSIFSPFILQSSTNSFHESKNLLVEVLPNHFCRFTIIFGIISGSSGINILFLISKTHLSFSLIFPDSCRETINSRYFVLLPGSTEFQIDSLSQKDSKDSTVSHLGHLVFLFCLPFSASVQPQFVIFPLHFHEILL